MRSPSPAFWAGFWAGLGGPASLYDAAPDYPFYLNGSSVALSFATVGIYLDHVSGACVNVGQPSTGQPASVSASQSSGTGNGATAASGTGATAATRASLP
jgi:hypothetical protein